MKCGCGFGRVVWIVASKGRTSNETQSYRYQHGFAPAQKVAREIRQGAADFRPRPAADVGGLGTGGYFWWRNFQNGPAYALAVMVDAVQLNDTATFDKMIDPDKISADFVSQVRDKMSGSLPGSLSSLKPTPPLRRFPPKTNRRSTNN